MPGKGYQKRQKEKRKLAKQARKAARQAVWDALKGTGKNKKNKHKKSQTGVSSVARVLMEVMTFRHGKRIKTLLRVHGGPECRNIGCKRCSPLWKI